MTHPPQDRPDYPWGPGEGDRPERETSPPLPDAPSSGGSTRMGGAASSADGPGAHTAAPYTGTPMSALPPLGETSQSPAGAGTAWDAPYTGTPAHVATAAPAGYEPAGATPVSTIVLLVLSGLAVFTGVFTLAGIPAAALAIVALTRTTSDPAGVRRLTRIGWWIFGGLVLLGLVLGVVGIALLIALGGDVITPGISGVGPVTPLTAALAPALAVGLAAA